MTTVPPSFPAQKLVLNPRSVLSEDGSVTAVPYEAQIQDVLIYEFYVPNAMLDDDKTRQFFDNAMNLPGGATIYPNMIGTWQKQTEPVTIYRIIIRTAEFGEEGAHYWIADEVARLMHQLKNTHSAQQEIMFTVSRCNAYSVKQTPQP